MKKIFIIVGGIILLIATAVFFMVPRIKGTDKAEAKKQNSSNTGSLSGLLAQARNSESKGALLDAKNAYQELINNFPESHEIMNWQKKIEDLNMRLLFSPIITTKSILYEIKPGDTLDKISKQFKTTSELVMKINSLSSDKIVPGKKIKVWTAPLSIVVDKSQNLLMLKSDEEIIKTYTVSTGANNSTPVGTYKIMSKLKNPTWFKAGTVIPAGSAENVLGTRWLGFDLPSYGIHGTTEPQNLGKQVTQGCVRMANSDVEELYMMIPLGTEVTIVD